MPHIDQLIFSNRKTIALIIGSDGSLTVRAPQFTDPARIKRLIAERSVWILRQRERINKAGGVFMRRYDTGEDFFYLGVAYPLMFSTGGRPALTLNNGSFVLTEDARPRAKVVFTEWYRRRAREIILPRLQSLAEQYGDLYEGVKITAARTRWGSCSAKNTLNFSLRLVMAPQWVIDYVIIHELVHLHIKNHSSRYWQTVADRLPEYRRCRDWLKMNTAGFAL